jgi:DNA polymerase-3 subunit alpha
MSKSGRPYGKFTLEDYSGSFTFTLFGEQYQKYKNFMSQGWFLFVEGAVQRNTWGNMNLEFQVRNIEILHDLASKRVQGIALRLPLHAITHDVITTLEETAKKNSGNASLHLFIYDDQQAIQTELLSRTCRITATNTVFQEFKKLGELGVLTDKTGIRWLTTEEPKELNVEVVEDGTNSPTFVLEPTEF